MAIKKPVGSLKVMLLSLNFINNHLRIRGVQRMKSYLITFIILNIIITITGCGGEEEESPSQETAQVVTEQTIYTKDLVSKPDFDFSSSTNLVVTIPASPPNNIGYFINICTDFSNVNNKVTINYASCKLRTTLGLVEQLFTLPLSTAEIVLIAQIWPIEEGAQPITIYWNIAETGKSWPITL